MDFVEATAAYESWLGSVVDLDQPDLAHKHDQLSDPADPFPFFRGTYYRWAQHWPAVCEGVADAPPVLAVGDLHVENFGTWRDADGRLCWGVNDFDEADALPYTHDLVRLAASARFAKQSGGLEIKLRPTCAAILDGYRSTLDAGGDPFVLEERHPDLRALATAADREPKPFWKKLTKLLADAPADVPKAAKAALLRDLPAKRPPPEFRRRPKVGVGSLGKPRFVALTEWAGGWIAREAKAATPPATAWATGEPRPNRVAEAVGGAVRSADPFYRPGTEWVVRRLAPRCSRIELDQLAGADDLTVLLRAMGAEAANVHLGTKRAKAAILRDLDRRPADWLIEAARAMAEAILQDWTAWRAAGGKR
jgi:hypothetical protein